jgi:uncharacterized protein (DUF2267 family)
MSTNLNALASTVDTTHAWLNELAGLLGWRDRHRAYLGLRAVLHALRDRLSVNQVAALGAQLPLLVRGLYYEGWHPHGKPLRERRKDQFLAHIRNDFHQDPGVDPEQVARAVFQLLADRVTAGEVEKVKKTLPADIRSLWVDELRVLSL